MALVVQEGLYANRCALLIALVAFLDPYRWRVVASSDGTTYGIDVNHAGSGANGLDNSRAWVLLESPDSDLWISFQRSTTNDQSWRWKLMRAFPSVGGSATETPTVPDPTIDEVVMVGGGSDAAPSFAVWGGVNTRAKFGAESSDGRFYCFGFADGTPNARQAALVADRPTNLDDDDACAWVVYCTHSQQWLGSQMGTTVSPGLFSFTADGPTEPAALNRRSGGGVVSPAAAAVHPITSDNGISEIPVIRRGQEGKNPCWKGVLTLIYYCDVAGHNAGDTYTLNSARDLIRCGDCALPWDGSVPTNGASGTTDRPAALLESFASSVTTGAVGSASSTVYLMQAVDSVTSALVHWTATSPDFAGIGYPGPNSPTLIAIAAKR